MLQHHVPSNVDAVFCATFSFLEHISLASKGLLEILKLFKWYMVNTLQ
jgi:hypothetical protein